MTRGCVIVARDLPPWHTKNVFTFHSRSRVRVKQYAWNLHQSCLTSRSISLKKNQAKLMIRTGVTVPNVQKCVMVATLTLRIYLTEYTYRDLSFHFETFSCALTFNRFALYLFHFCSLRHSAISKLNLRFFFIHHNAE